MAMINIAFIVRLISNQSIHVQITAENEANRSEYLPIYSLNTKKREDDNDDQREKEKERERVIAAK